MHCSVEIVDSVEDSADIVEVGVDIVEGTVAQSIEQGNLIWLAWLHWIACHQHKVVCHTTQEAGSLHAERPCPGAAPAVGPGGYIGFRLSLC